MPEPALTFDFLWDAFVIGFVIAVVVVPALRYARRQARQEARRRRGEADIQVRAWSD
jgi:heme exporter protein D